VSKLKIAAVGLGWVALHRHLPALRRSGLCEVVGVVDSHPGRAEQVAKAQGLRRFAQARSLRDVPWLDEVDAVTVSTAPMSHRALVGEALELGKHVLAEKPFAMAVAEGEELVALSQSCGRALGIVHNFQFASSVRQLESDIAAGRLGAIKGIDATQWGNPRRRLPAWYEQLPLGLFYDESPHLLYLLRRFAGELSVKRSLVTPGTTGLATPARVDVAFAAPQCAAPVWLRCNFESPVSEWVLVVYGEQALGIVDIFRDIYIRLPNDGVHSTLPVIRTSVAATVRHWLGYLRNGIPHLRGTLLYGNDEVVRRFVAGTGGDRAALEPISGDSALAVLRLQHEIVRSADVLRP
jgi:scyllo-inositol 2-dehydrogenase (NADP+)